jgi:hypothetical protein
LPTAKRGALEGAPCSPILLLLYFDSVLRAADRVTHPGAGVPVTTYGDDGATTLVSVRCHSLGFGVVFESCVCPCCTRARTPPTVGCSGWRYSRITTQQDVLFANPGREQRRMLASQPACCRTSVGRCLVQLGFTIFAPPPPLSNPPAHTPYVIQNPEYRHIPANSNLHF